MKQLSRSIFFLLVIALLCVGCDLEDDTIDAPAVYGQNGQCYYTLDPAEVIALQRAGLCPTSWVAAPMPILWEETYFSFYSSPIYYDYYVPQARRTYYRTVTVRTFSVKYRREITRYRSRGKWRKTRTTIRTKTITRTKTTVRRFRGRR